MPSSHEASDSRWLVPGAGDAEQAALEPDPNIVVYHRNWSRQRALSRSERHQFVDGVLRLHLDDVVGEPTVVYRCHVCGDLDHGKPSVAAPFDTMVAGVSSSTSPSVTVVGFASSSDLGIDVVDAISVADYSTALDSTDEAFAALVAHFTGYSMAQQWAAFEAVGKLAGVGVLIDAAAIIIKLRTTQVDFLTIGDAVLAVAQPAATAAPIVLTPATRTQP